MTGRDKVKLWVIGKNKTPRSFKNFNVERHVKWSFNQKAWMTGENFNQYLKWFDTTVAAKHKTKCVLVLDNAPAHKVDT